MSCALKWQTLTGAQRQVDSNFLKSEATNKRLKLSAGMLVSAEIHQRQRTVMEYLISPIQKVTQEAARER
jgi:hemolysin D